MKHVRATLLPHAGTDDKRAYDMDGEATKVHYDGPFLIGSHSLCGLTDIIGFEFVETTKRVNCPGCIATRNHVLGK